MKAEQQEMKPRKLKTTPVKREISEKEINDITMNMLKPNANGCFDALDEECRLWQELENNPPPMLEEHFGRQGTLCGNP